jgi:hypothetical protein
MKSRFGFLAGVPAAAVLLAFAAGPAAAGDEAASLLATMRKSLGGEAIEAIRSSRVEFTFVEEGREGPPTRVRLITAVPDRMRMFQSGSRGDSEIGFDGVRGWMSDARGGFLPLDAETCRLMSRGPDLQSLPRRLPDLFERFEISPLTEFDGRPSRPLVAFDEAGDATRIHLDPASGLPLGLESSEETPEGPQRNRIRFEGWRREGEVMVFDRAEIEQGRRRTTIEFRSIRFNEVGDAEFAPPAAIAADGEGAPPAQVPTPESPPAAPPSPSPTRP